MVSLLNDAQWQKVIKELNNAHPTFNTDTVYWYRSIMRLDRFGEDSDEQFAPPIALKALMQYNAFRTWPLNTQTSSGELDTQSVVMLINNSYAKQNGWVNENGYFNYNFDADRFVHLGIEYKATGDTPLSQTPIGPILTQIVLKREERPTGQKINDFVVQLPSAPVTPSDDLYSGIAGEVISALRGVYLNDSSRIRYFNSTDPALYGKFLGISKTAALAGGTVAVYTEGVITDNNWNLVPGAPYFINGTNGEISAIAPELSPGILQQVGIAINNKSLQLNTSLTVLL